MGKSAAPSAPDPYQSAAAQYQYGTQAAAYNTALQRPNVVTPYGSTSWAVAPGSSPQGGGGFQGGGNPGDFPVGGNPGGGSYGGGGGGPVASSIPPQYTETQALSPAEQQLLGTREAATQQAGTAAQAGMANNPLPTAGQNQQFGDQARQAAYGYATSTLDPYWGEQQRQLDSSLRNSGATPGTPAYDNAMTQFHTQRNQAYSQAENASFGQGLEAQGQQISDIGQLRGIPLNEYTALSTGGQIAPGGGGGGAGAGSVGSPNIMDAFQNQYQGQLGAYNANVASTNTDIGTAAAVIAQIIASSSDKRTKKDIQPLQAKTPRGNPLYLYRYNFQGKDEPKQVGVMAQEVEKRNPEAVFKDSKGMRYVDYSRA